MNIIELAFDMARAVESFVEKTKKFFYSVVLVGLRCSKCNGQLIMLTEGRYKCAVCGYESNPTIDFQRCSACGGIPVLKIRRYQCKDCGREITSMFLFDGLVFDAEYFRVKMTESRQHKKELKERVKQMLAECRSEPLQLHPVDSNAFHELLNALDGFIKDTEQSFEIESRDGFNLKQYEEHIKAYIQDFPLSLDEIPPLSKENARKDLIWRFIAVIYLAHFGVVDLMQDGQDILVMKHETDRKGQGVFGELEKIDRNEGPMGGTEAG